MPDTDDRIEQAVSEEIRKLCFSSKTRWLLYIPFQTISAKAKPYRLDTLGLNLCDFAMPEMAINMAPAHYNGEYMNLPSNVKDYPKIFAVSYLMSEDWSQFDILSDYFDMLSDLENSHAKYEKVGDIAINPEFFVLSAYKNPIFSIKFYNAFLYSMGELSFSYSDTEDEIVSQTIGFTYTHWTKHRYRDGKPLRE